MLGIVFGIDVDQLDDPVAVGAGRRGEQVGDDRAGHRHVLGQAARSRSSGRRGEGGRTSGPEPARAVQSGPAYVGDDGPRTVGDGMGGVREIGIEAGVVLIGGRRLERQPAVLAGIKPLGRGLPRRPAVVRLPGVRSRAKGRWPPGTTWRPRSLRWAANQGAWILARKCLPVAEPNSTGPSLSPSPLRPAAVVPRTRRPGSCSALGSLFSKVS